MSKPEWQIRSGQPNDRALLAAFTCADPAVEVEVEKFIRTQLIDWSFDPHAADGDPRLLLAFIAATGTMRTRWDDIEIRTDSRSHSYAILGTHRSR